MKAGRYELHEVLGTGAFATVYRGTDPRLDASVAVKVLADNWSRDPEVRRRFRSEAVLLRRVQAEAEVPGIVDVFDIDETDEGQPFFVLSFADRGTLRTRAGSKPWPIADVVPVIDALAETVGALHRAVVVHRDLKPSNLLLRSDRGTQASEGHLIRKGERLLISDLGLAKDASLDTTALSFAGGTARYMAPEQQIVGSTIDHRADIHAASVIIAELLAGTDSLPPAGSLLQDQLPPSLDELVRQVLDKGVSTDPFLRQSSMQEWRAELLAALAQSADDAPGSQTNRLSRRLMAGLVAAILAVAALLTGVAIARDSDSLDIVGPDQLVVGEQATYRLAEGGTAVWTDWEGAQVSADEFEILASLPGQLEFTAEQERGSQRLTVQVVESRLGPSINGPDTIRLGQTAVFTATLPATATSSFWIGSDGASIESADFRVAPTAVGDIVLSLVAVDAAGVERGTRMIVQVTS